MNRRDDRTLQVTPPPEFIHFGTACARGAHRRQSWRTPRLVDLGNDNALGGKVKIGPNETNYSPTGTDEGGDETVYVSANAS